MNAKQHDRRKAVARTPADFQVDIEKPGAQNGVNLCISVEPSQRSNGKLNSGRKGNWRIAVAFLGVAFGAQCFAEPLKLLVVGDSVTQARGDRGADGGYSYRYELWKLFTDAGVDVNFVGSQNSNWRGNPTGGFPAYREQPYDTDHEGHWGWTANEIVNGPGSNGQGFGLTSGSGRLDDWLNDAERGYTPDAALVLIGANDIRVGRPTNDIIDSMSAIVHTLQADNPHASILVGQYYNFDNISVLPDSAVGELNAAIVAMASDLTTEASNVFAVDHSDGFEAVNHTYDGAHPNSVGENLIASTWFKSLTEHAIISPTYESVPVGFADSYTETFDEALGIDGNKTDVDLPTGWSVAHNDTVLRTTITNAFQQRLRDAPTGVFDVYNAGVDADSDRALATGVSRDGGGNELQLRTAVTGGDATQMRLQFDMEAWGTKNRTGSSGEAAFQVVAEVEGGDGFVQVLDFGTVSKDMVAERTINGNDAAFNKHHDSQWRDVQLPENSTLRLRWVTDTASETPRWVFGIDNVILQFGVLGDFGRDGFLEIDDLETLTAAIHMGSTDSQFDLDKNGVIESADAQHWVTAIKRTRIGDSDLDGEVGFSDFLVLAANFGGPGGWQQGDFDINGEVQFPDFLLMSENFGETASDVAPVPEPSGIVTLSFCFLSLAALRRRRPSTASMSMWLNCVGRATVGNSEPPPNAAAVASIAPIYYLG